MPLTGTIQPLLIQGFTAFPSGGAINISPDFGKFADIVPRFAYDFPRESPDSGAHMASFEKLVDGKYRAHVQKRGVRKSRTFDTKRQAQDWANRVESEIVDKGKKDSHTFDELADKYLEDVTEHKRGKRWEKLRIESFREHFGEMVVEGIDSPEIAAWRDMRGREVSPSTVTREANVLRAMFRVARDEWRWIERSPFTGVKLPKQNPPRNSVWGWREIRRVLRAPAGNKMREVVDAFHIALRTGMRLQEVLSAPENFDKRRRVVTVKTKMAPQGEEIPIGRIAAKLLDREPFTVNPNTASVLFSRLCRYLLIEGKNFHDARATALTHLARKVDVMTLARISRHRDLRLLMSTYYRETNDSIAKRI